MVTLKIAGLVIAALLGFGFTPTYLDYLTVGRWLRRAYAAGRANPSFVVASVLAVASLIPVGMLVYALVSASALALVVVGDAVVFIVYALVAVVATPPPRGLPLPPPGPSYVAEFLDGEG